MKALKSSVERARERPFEIGVLISTVVCVAALAACEPVRWSPGTVLCTELGRERVMVVHVASWDRRTVRFSNGRTAVLESFELRADGCEGS